MQLNLIPRPGDVIPEFQASCVGSRPREAGSRVVTVSSLAAGSSGTKPARICAPPVTKRLYLEEWFPGEKFKAGESALEELTLLGSPRRATWAVTPARWKTLQQEPGTHLIPDAAKDNAHAEFELWRYDPALLATTPQVDALSLVLGFQNIPDERIQLAVDDVLRKFPW